MVVLAASGLLFWRMTNSDPADTYKDLNSAIAKSGASLNADVFLVPKGQYIGGPKLGYEYKPGSVAYASGVLSFQLVNNTGNTVQIAAQNRDKRIDPSENEYKGRKQINYSLGVGVLGQNKDFTSAAIIGNDVMIFVRSEEIIGDEILEELMGSFSSKLPDGYLD